MCTAFNSILFRQQWVFSSEFRMQSASDRKIKRKVEHGNSGSSRAKLWIPCKNEDANLIFITITSCYISSNFWEYILSRKYQKIHFK